MRIVVSGSRTLRNLDTVLDAWTDGLHEANPWETPWVLLHGGAAGVDRIVAESVEADTRYGLTVRFDADWEAHGKRAGVLRNVKMLEQADALVAIWDGESRGTKHAIDAAVKMGVPVYLRIVSPDAVAGPS